MKKKKTFDPHTIFLCSENKKKQKKKNPTHTHGESVKHLVGLLRQIHLSRSNETTKRLMASVGWSRSVIVKGDRCARFTIGLNDISQHHENLIICNGFCLPFSNNNKKNPQCPPKNVQIFGCYDHVCIIIFILRSWSLSCVMICGCLIDK